MRSSVEHANLAFMLIYMVLFYIRTYNARPSQQDSSGFRLLNFTTLKHYVCPSYIFSSLTKNTTPVTKPRGTGILQILRKTKLRLLSSLNEAFFRSVLRGNHTKFGQLKKTQNRISRQNANKIISLTRAVTGYVHSRNCINPNNSKTK